MHGHMNAKNSKFVCDIMIYWTAAHSMINLPSFMDVYAEINENVI